MDTESREERRLRERREERLRAAPTQKAKDERGLGEKED